MAGPVDVPVAPINVFDGDITVEGALDMEVLPLVASPEDVDSRDNIEVDCEDGRAEAWIDWITARGIVMSALAGIWPRPSVQQVWLASPVERGQTEPS